MFNISNNQKISSDIPEIKSNYLELLADENPILYTGTNGYNSRILGIIIEEGEGLGVFYYHIIIRDEEYIEFIEKRKTLRTILQEAGVIFILERIEGVTEAAYVISAEEVPEDYLPQESSYCPPINFPPSLNFGISLKGKKSDEHKIDTHEGSQIQNTIEEVLKTTLHSLSDFDLKPRTFLEPAEVGSFRLNYHIEFAEQFGFFPVDEEVVTKFIKSFLSFLVSKLPNENLSLNQNHIQNEALQALSTELEEIYTKQGIITKTSEQVGEIIRDTLNSAAKKLEEVSTQITNSKSFDRVQILNYQPSGEEVPLGIIDQTYYEKVKAKLIELPPIIENTVTETDPEPKQYRILVYELNTESGNCYAYLFIDDTENFQKVKIDIDRGDKQLTNSLYSNSQNEPKVITISGIAEKVNGKYKVIHVKL